MPQSLAAVSALVAPALLIACFTGCGEEGRITPLTVATPCCEEGGFSPFYGEAVEDGRLYVFGKKLTYDRFMESKSVDPQKSVRKIGAGPGGMTVILETSKDEPAMEERIRNRVMGRYGLTKI
jgi:hypothetical protein